MALTGLVCWTAALERRVCTSLRALRQQRLEHAGELANLLSRVAALEEHARVRKDVVRLEVKSIIDQALQDQRREVDDLKQGLEGVAHQLETLREYHQDDVKLLRRDVDAALAQIDAV